ncbi:hypothetical protein SDC9_20889 [bioreactor metagenome]|uniref:Helix-turn-helix domain-containing protein n=1 Tax=bioreactor metagenome TaxID=1076179 RepID=A0A644U803_9ZZZZ|nr:helix-turn-helix domain-containing protein [Negativicutes bacterium]
MNKKSIQQNIIIPDGIGFELLYVAEAASMLRVGVSVIYKLIRSGKLQAIKIGQAWKIPRASIQDYVASLSNE